MSNMRLPRLPLAWSSCRVLAWGLLLGCTLAPAAWAAPDRRQADLRLPEQPSASSALVRALSQRQGTEYTLFSQHAAATTAAEPGLATGGRKGNLLWASLAAEGFANESDFRPQQRRVEELARRFRADVRSSANVRTQAAVLLQLLHAEVFTGGYELRCSTLSETLRTGKYNCVTATILYVCLCEEVGLEAWGVEIPAHVYAEVNDGGRPLRVETTCARWFELVDRDPLLAERSVPGRPADAGSHRGSSRLETAAGQDANTAGPRALDAWQMVAILYYNRGVDHAEQDLYPAAVAANQKALKLDPASRTARKNLLGAINNWALSLADDDQYSEALALLEHGRLLAPDHATFATNVIALYQRWVDQLCRAAQFSEADAVVLSALQKHADARLAAEQFVVYRRWGSHLVSAKQVDQTLKLCALMRARHGADARAASAEADLLVAVGWALLEQQRPAEALRLFDDSSRRFPQNVRLQEERTRAYQLHRSLQVRAGRGA